MQFMDPEEEDPNSWVSIKSLREAAEVKSVYRSSSRTSPIHSPESSVSHEPRPMNVYLSAGKSGREKQQTASLSFDCGGGSASRMEELTSRRVSALEGETGHLADVVKMMHRQLVHDKAEIKGLKKEIAMMQQEFAAQKTSIQSHWKKKLQKIAAEIEAQTAAFARRLEAEKDKLRNEFEEKIDALRAEHEMELQDKEEEWEASREKQAESPVQPQVRAQDIEEKYRRTIEAMEKRHIDEIARLKASLPERQVNPATLRRQPAASARGSEAAVSPTSEQEVEALRQANRELKKQLEEERQRYADLQIHAQATFRKKPQRSLAQTMDPSDARRPGEGLEGEIKTLIGQINSHLENSDLFNSSFTLADSLRNICLKIDQLSSSGFIQI